MENETPKPEVKEKSLWATLKGTLQGMNNEGSAKRITSFYAVAFLLTSLLAVYEYAYTIAAMSKTPTTVQTQIVSDYKEIFWTLVVMILTLLGFATLELITSIVKKVTGQKTEDVK